MKLRVVFACSLLALAAAGGIEGGRPKQAALDKIIGLLMGMQKELENEADKEQAFFDKYACWCERTTAKKLKAMSDAKSNIEMLGERILNAKGSSGTLEAEVADLKKQIQENNEAIADAEARRSEENGAYRTKRSDDEQAVGALEGAIRVMTGAGTGTGFLSTLQKGQLVSATRSLHKVLQSNVVTRVVPSQDLEIITDFVSRAEESGKTISLLQAHQNPFGDYAPASTQIQGILKGMYDGLAQEIEKDNVEEANAQKAFEELMATKKDELKTLTETFTAKDVTLAENTQQAADDEDALADTKEELESTETFFEDMKAGCKLRAKEMAERVRLRNEEMNGIIMAIGILQKNEALFFMQRSLVSTNIHQGTRLSKVASMIKSKANFDAVVKVIDKMIKQIQREIQDAIERKDECENDKKKNADDNADLVRKKEKLEAKKTSLEEERTELTAMVTELERAVAENLVDREDATKEREEEKKKFQEELKATQETIEIVKEATVALKAFYIKNKIPIGLVQKQPEYTVDSDQAPKVNWGEEGGSYGGSSKRTGGIISIMDSVVEDLQNDQKSARAEENEAEMAHKKEIKALDAEVHAQKATITKSKVRISGIAEELADNLAETGATNEAVTANFADKDKIELRCRPYLPENFEKAQADRKTEIEGLQEAKASITHIPR